jgi:membrane dipeptidase
MKLIVDAHQDLAWNMLTFGRDYTLSAYETRRREHGTQIPERNGDSLLGWPEYQQGHVALVFSTLFASPERKRTGDWDAQSYLNIAGARSLYSRQLDAYNRLQDRYPDQFHLIASRADLDALLDHWHNPEHSEHPVGLLPLMEGAECIREPQEVEDWWQRGVRIIGLAWAGNHFCGGTGEPGPLTSQGYALLDHMAQFGFILDISHLDEAAALQALDHYPGRVIASHANAHALLKGAETNRHLSDRVLQSLIERQGVVGVVPLGGFLKAGWKTGQPRSEVGLDRVAAQIDYVCQKAGNASCTGLGTDFDGGYGVQSTPAEIDTIADMQKIGPLLVGRGYSDDDITAIMGGNWITLLQESLPENS